MEFYDAFFENVTTWAEPSKELGLSALDIASKNDLGAMDALHIASAVKCQAFEFITTEGQGKPLNRVKDILVRFIS